MTQTSPINTGFSFSSTAAEVIDGIDLTGARAIVTGASSGIGVETARVLASAGAEITLAVRNVDAGRRVAGEIEARHPGARVEARELDLAQLDSVSAFVDGWDGPLHLLINNAGVMALPELTLTDRGWELQFATNHVGHFALATGLYEALLQAGQGNGARVVSLSSRGHLRSPVVFDDIHFSARPYEPWAGYGQSKTANVLFAVEAHRRWASDGITVNAVHPGGILDTNLTRHMDPELVDSYRAIAQSEQEAVGPTGAPLRFKTIEQGAATTVLAATLPILRGVGGRYFEDCNEAHVLPADFAPTVDHGVAPYALDPDAAAQLWELSERLVSGDQRR
jgi:NAD(P)-dependent dehydrogenase (short-subunit alcohol dehydrogenase family)